MESPSAVAEGMVAMSKEEAQKLPKPRFDKVIPTGSTLADLAISGTRVRGGGIPGGVMVEIFGMPGIGKTAFAAEIMGRIQAQGGDVQYNDPEGRLDREYARLFGVHLPDDRYHKPDTVKEMFDLVSEWLDPKQANRPHFPNPLPKNVISGMATDSLAALSTEMEMEDWDKMGMKRASDFSKGFRKVARQIAGSGIILVCTNQVREDADSGQLISPGGKAMPHYFSIRIHMKNHPEGGIWEDTQKNEYGVEQTRKIGNFCMCKCVKSSVDVDWREFPLSIMSNYGIDDVRDQLMWQKRTTGAKKFWCAPETEYQFLDKAINWIEGSDVKEEEERKKARLARTAVLKERTISIWEKQEGLFVPKRPAKYGE